MNYKILLKCDKAFPFMPNDSIRLLPYNNRLPLSISLSACVAMFSHFHNYNKDNGQLNVISRFSFTNKHPPS